MDELTGHDYVNKPLSELMKHHDFSRHAFNVVMAMLEMKTTQLENLDITGVTNA